MSKQQNIHGYRKMAKWLKSKKVNSDLEKPIRLRRMLQRKTVSAKTQHRLRVMKDGK